MISGIRVLAGSGAMGNTVTSLYANGRATPRIEIFNLEAGATNAPNRLGMFGSAGAPSSPVVVGFYQDRTHICDHVGSDFGALVNVKFSSSNTAIVSGVPFTAGLANIPQASSTIVLRFTEPNGSLVTTQGGIFRAINLTAASGAADISTLATGLVIKAAQLTDTAGNTGNSTWTEITSGGSTLNLANQLLSSNVHDYHLIISSSPSSAGRKIDFAYYCSLEFL